MPLFKRTLSEFIFRRFMLKHFAPNLLLDLKLEAEQATLEYNVFTVVGQQLAVRILSNPMQSQ